MKFRYLLSFLILSTVLATKADTVLLDEDFNVDYTKSFAYLFDGDAQEPHRSIAPIFYSNAAGATMPWWIAKDYNEATDKFIASHSYYATPGKSNDWLISAPITIPTEGFVLEFDAQCVNVRGTQYISDLSLYILDKMITVTDLPSNPTHIFKEVPYGKDLDNCENDWTHYVVSLDEYVGKTIYINFVNQNTDKDILCLDNVKVVRHDIIKLDINEYDETTTDLQANLTAQISAITPDGVKDWSLKLLVDGKEIKSWDGAKISAGEAIDIDAVFDLNQGDVTSFEFVIKCIGQPELSYSGNITQLAFETTHRIFFEETTSIFCGNCPMGICNVESMMKDDFLKDRVLPVSVHIPGLGHDPMVTEAYYPNLPNYSAAPLIFVNRNQTYDGLVPAYDLIYDPTNPNSFAYRMTNLANQYAIMDIDVDADWVIEGSDTTRIVCRANVRPAINIKDKEYRVAFVLTENNVCQLRNIYWIQDNYLSGSDVANRCGGWSDLPEKVIDVRYQDVARAISQYNGHRGSLPRDMNAGDVYPFSYTMSIPDTYLDSNGIHVSDAIHRNMCEITAIIIESETGLVVNAARVHMSPDATKKFLTADLLQTLGVEDVLCSPNDYEGEAIYYDMTGRVISNPTHGIFIRRTAAGSSIIKR